jgi:hypothetical protein
MLKKIEKSAITIMQFDE